MEGNPESERFVQVAQAEDPFTADALEAVLKGAGMSVLRTDHPGIDSVIADARALDLPDNSTDAVLLLGPLYHLEDRGLIREGYWADLTVFHPQTIFDRTTYL